MKISKSSMDFTQGTILKNILLFAIPLLCTSLIQQLYNTVDLWFAGNFLDDKSNATASVGASSMMITCIINFFTGMSVGVSIIVSKAIGSKNTNRIDKTIHTAMGISIIGGIFLSILGICFAETYLNLMDTPQEIFNSSLSYIRVYMLSMLFVVTYNMNSGIIRAMGNSNITMWIQLIGGLVNVLMDYISVVIFNLGIDGIAWATMFSQGISAILSIVYLATCSKEYSLKLKKIHIYSDIIKDVLKIGIPAGVQSLIITLSNVFIQYKINNFNDVNNISAFSIYFKVELLVYLPILAFGQAMTTFSGQNFGANKTDNIRKGVIICIAMGITYTLIASTIIIILGRYAFGVFNQDIDVIECGMRIVRTSFPFYWVYVILEVLADTIRGTGKSIEPTIIIMANICGLRTLLLAIFTYYNQTIEAVAIVYPISWITTALSFIIYYRCIFLSKTLNPRLIS